jgi:hypothetical protein
MLLDPPLHPQRYDSSLERPEKDEAETTEALVDTLRKISETTYKDGGHALRSVHAKTHGLLRGELIVAGDLPAVLAQGLFAAPGVHPVIMRYSTTPGDILDDSVSTPRGLAIKVLDVDGERLPGSRDARTQDFVLVNGKTFSTPNAKAFLANLKLLAGTADKAEGLKKVLSATLQGVEAALESVGAKSGTLIAMGGQAETDVLGESYYSQVPILYGDYIAKIAVTPASDELKALTDQHIKLGGHPDGLRDAVVAFFREHGGVWDVKVQLCTDIDKMPVENAAMAWPEDESPYLPVARIVMPPQEAWSTESQASIDDGMAFSPWHGLAAHRPLGSIMRVRKSAYEMSADFRGSHNGCPIHEPRSFLS